MIKDFKKWLSTPCPPEEIKYVDEENRKGEYIPIGIIEQNLDEFDNWDTEWFNYNVQKVERLWVASGTVLLVVKFGDTVIKRLGSTTFVIHSKPTNEDFEGTALSLAIANAAKKLGKRFGRHLNGRLVKGDVAPVIDLQAQRDLDAAIDEVNECTSNEQLKDLYDNKYIQYQKIREFIVAVSNMKQLLKIKATKDAKSELPDNG